MNKKILEAAKEVGMVFMPDPTHGMVLAPVFADKTMLEAYWNKAKAEAFEEAAKLCVSLPMSLGLNRLFNEEEKNAWDTGALNCAEALRQKAKELK